MKTLVLCIDRDNDFGEKAGVKSPILGRQSNLDAALSLILKDPEDSDSNAVFSGISTYDNLVKAGENVEIATICGDKMVGEISDSVLMKQLDHIVSTIQPTDVIIVSDGAEDEYVIPLVMSRIKIRTIKKVIIRQEKNIESIYYIVVKALKEEKFLRKVIAPVGVVLLVLGIVMLLVLILRIYLYGLGILDPGTAAYIGVSTALGIYFLGKAYTVGKRLSYAAYRITEEFLYTRITVFFFLVAVALFGFGVYLGYSASLHSSNLFLAIIITLYRIVPFTILAIVIYDLGRIIEGFTIYEKGKRKNILVSYLLSAGYSIGFSAAVMGLLSFGAAGLQQFSLKSLYDYLALVLTIGGIASGIVFSREKKKYDSKHEVLDIRAGTPQEDNSKNGI